MTSVNQYAAILSAQLEVVEPRRRESVIKNWLKKSSGDLSYEDVMYALSRVSDDFRRDREMQDLLDTVADNYNRR